MGMTGSLKECQKECAMIPVSVLEQYGQALRQQGIKEDDIDDLVRILFVNMMDQVKLHIKCIADILDRR